MLSVARSSTKVEYRALAHTAAELMWIKFLLSELHVEYHVPTYYVTTSMLSCYIITLYYTRGSNIMNFDIHFVREKIMAKQLDIQHVLAHAQLVDALTKSLPTTIRNKFKVVLLESP